MKSISVKRGGENESSWVQNHCKNCGWSGEKHYAFEDYQMTSRQRESLAHECPKK